MEVSQPQDQITHAVIGGGKTIDFGISNSAEFFDILSRTLYTDQILAVVREVLCNAWDAHITAGCTDKAIEITLDNQHLVVRDHGYGIQHDQIGPIYGVYGASTKKNDGAQTGGFGLGCKAPFAYTDHFEVISHHAGGKTIYNMSKSNAVAKGKPGIITLMRLPSTEQGLQVKIPIQDIDYSRFKSVIERIVKNGEMKAELNKTLLPVTKYSEAVNGYIMTTNAVMGMNNIYRNIHVRYGNVIYPIDSCDELKSYYKDIEMFLGRFQEQHRPHALVLQAPPDSIAVTPSREALSMQEHTITTLKKLFKKFLAHVEPLNEEIQIQMKLLVNKTIAEKNYNAIFHDGWGFYQNPDNMFTGNITDLVSMAKYCLTKSYPSGNIKFRLADIEYRISKATELKILDPHLSKTFLDELPTVKDFPSKYSRSKGDKSSDWLHRRIIGKVMVKLRDAGLDETGLMIRDTKDPGYLYNKNSKVIPVRQVFGRNHLINMPYIRKTVVITTAITQLDERLYAYSSHNKDIKIDGLLVYYIRTRTKGYAEPVIDVFTKLGYEIIDLTKHHTWEAAPKPVAPRKKPEAYTGLPALNCIVKSHGIHVQAFRDETINILPTPELVVVISQRNGTNYAIDGYSVKATKALVGLYGNRIGIAKDKAEMNRAIKNGAKHYKTVVEQEMLTVMVNSPALKEYFAFDLKRVRDTLSSRKVDSEALSLIYLDPDLRKEFGLLKNLTVEEQSMLTLYRQVSIFSDTTMDTIKQYIDTIPLAPENKKVIAACKSDNEMLDILDLTNVRAGLKGLKRTVYLDILIKVLKG